MSLAAPSFFPCLFSYPTAAHLDRRFPSRNPACAFPRNYQRHTGSHYPDINRAEQIARKT